MAAQWNLSYRPAAMIIEEFGRHDSFTGHNSHTGHPHTGQLSYRPKWMADTTVLCIDSSVIHLPCYPKRYLRLKNERNSFIKLTSSDLCNFQGNIICAYILSILLTTGVDAINIRAVIWRPYYLYFYIYLYLIKH